MVKVKTLIRSMLIPMLLSGVMFQSSHAALVGTPSLVTGGDAAVDTASMRQDIQQRLVELGVEPAQAFDRVAAMTDQQVTEITGRLGDLPAGADAGSVILTVFIVFVITDVIGATDIFPFIKPVR